MRTITTYSNLRSSNLKYPLSLMLKIQKNFQSFNFNIFLIFVNMFTNISIIVMACILTKVTSLKFPKIFEQLQFEQLLNC